MIAAVTALQDRPDPGAIILSLDTSPLPEPGGRFRGIEVARIFVRLRLERVDDPAVLRFTHARTIDGTTAEIRIGGPFVGEFLEACRLMAAGHEDFGLGAGPARMPLREWRRLPELDRQARGALFWGSV